MEASYQRSTNIYESVREQLSQMSRRAPQRLSRGLGLGESAGDASWIELADRPAAGRPFVAGNEGDQPAAGPSSAAAVPIQNPQAAHLAAPAVSDGVVGDDGSRGGVLPLYQTGAQSAPAVRRRRRHYHLNFLGMGWHCVMVVVCPLFIVAVGTAIYLVIVATTSNSVKDGTFPIVGRMAKLP